MANRQDMHSFPRMVNGASPARPRWVSACHACQVLGLAGGLWPPGPPPRGGSDDDPRKFSAYALAYVEKNQHRTDYPGYRRLDLPISSAAVERLIKTINRRMNGTEQFGKEGERRRSGL